MKENQIKDQLIGSIVEKCNHLRKEDLEKIISQINQETLDNLKQQDINFIKALDQIEIVQKFVNSPEKILGSIKTKHGEIAEQVEVGVANAQALLSGHPKVAIIEPSVVGRTINAPVDYIIDGMKVQSKFNQNELNSLRSVLDHLKKYENIGFARSDGSFYHIPSDQYENILKMLKHDSIINAGDSKYIEAVIREIHKIETESGKKFLDIVKSSASTYDEVQLNNIQNTLDEYRKKISNVNEIYKNEYERLGMTKKDIEIYNHKPSFKDASKNAAIGAAISGTITFSLNVYRKNKEGKKIKDFTEDDWKEVGFDTVEQTVKGGITGYSIYGLTNLANMSAPYASGLVSAVYGMASLIADFRNGNMTFDEFLEDSEMLCVETSFVTVGALVGQMCIPIPEIGAVVGSVVSSIVFDIGKTICNENELPLLNQYRIDSKNEIDEYNRKYLIHSNKVKEKYDELGGILAMAFDFDLNCQIRLKNSINYANKVGVEKEEILNDYNDIYNYFNI